MWVRKDCPLCEIVGMVTICCLVALYAYYTYGDDDHFYNNFHISVWSEMDFGCYSVSRLILMYYFYKVFDKYPWSKWPGYFDDDLYYKTKIKSTSIRLITLLVLYIVIMIGHLIYETSIDQPNDNGYANYYLRVFLDSVLTSSYAVYIPIMTSQCVLTYLLLRYELYLYRLRSTMKHNMDKESLKEVFTSYISMIESFNTQYGQIWQVILLCQAIAMFYVIWNSIAKLENYYRYHELSAHQFAWLWISSITEIYHIVPFIEYVYSSSRLNDEYDRFKNCYWKLMIDTVGNPMEINNTNYHKHRPRSINSINYVQAQADENPVQDFALNIVFLEYIIQHGFYIYLSGMKVTIANSLKCIILFAVTKLMSISINDYLIDKH